jgi:hypothetical protein
MFRLAASDRRVVRWGRGSVVVVDILPVDVDGVADEGGAPVAALGVSLFEAEELDLGGEEVEEGTAHVGIE